MLSQAPDAGHGDVGCSLGPTRFCLSLIKSFLVILPNLTFLGMEMLVYASFHWKYVFFKLLQ